MRLDPDEGRRRFATSTLLTTEGLAQQEQLCRVCAGTVRVGEPIRKRQWHLDVSHASCGWLRIDEHDRHERRRPGTVFSYWEWRCPYCGLDACSVRAPRDDDDPRCKRCNPRPELADGVKVEIVIGISFRVGRGKRPRLMCFPPYTRARVLKVSGELAHVEILDGRPGLQTWVRTIVLSTIS